MLLLLGLLLFLTFDVIWRQNSPGSDRTRSRADNEQIAPDLTVENSRLVARLATLQQEKWRIEERVSHLEENNATMAQELINRGKLIQHYCMDTRIVKSGWYSSHPSSFMCHSSISAFFPPRFASFNGLFRPFLNRFVFILSCIAPEQGMMREWLLMINVCCRKRWIQ